MTTRRKPTAVRLDTADIVLEAAPAEPEKARRPGKQHGKTKTSDRVEIGGDAIDAALAEAQTRVEAREVRRRGFRWGRLFLAALAGLISLSFGLAVERLIRELFARNDILGQIGLGLLALAAIGLLAMALREAIALLRLRRIDRLKAAAEKALEDDDSRAARRVLGNLAELYSDRPDTARGRAALDAHRGEIIDGGDLIRLAERDLLSPLDKRARTQALEAAKRVAVVTAVSPRAVVDIAFVLYANLKLIRQVSLIYGGRPGLFGFFKLLGHVVGHLAVTGGVSAGDSILQQLVGHGLAARLSARLGEGVVNGLMTARVGVSAIHVCRPLPFIETGGPAIRDFLGELTRLTGGATEKGDEAE